MTYDERLADRVRAAVVELARGATERSMFGGLCFLVGGKMFVGIVRDDLMVRVGADAYDATLEEPHVRVMDFTGKPMRGYVYVEAAGMRTEAQLRTWLERGLHGAKNAARARTPRSRTPRARRAR